MDRQTAVHRAEVLAEISWDRYTSNQLSLAEQVALGVLYAAIAQSADETTEVEPPKPAPPGFTKLWREAFYRHSAQHVGEMGICIHLECQIADAWRRSME